MLHIRLQNNVREFEKGTTIAEIAKSIGMGLFKSACAGKLNGKLVDLRTSVEEDASVEICTFDSDEGKHAYWHTTAHILAQAV